MKNKKLNIWFYIFIFIDVLSIICLVVLYGPWENFRNFWITSSMTTATHQYLARTFYSKTQILETLNNNYVEQIVAETDSSMISFSSNDDNGVYESFYEEQILKRDEGNELYKRFEISVNNSTAHVVVIYDPSRIEYALSKYVNVGGQQLVDLAQSQGAVIAINASGFEMDGTRLIPTGTVIRDGKILYKSGKFGKNSGLIGFNKDNVLVLTTKSPKEAIADGLEDAITFGPFLYVNGQPATIKGNGGWGYAPRTVIAQRQDGIVLFIVFDGRDLNKRVLGASMNDLIEILSRYKAYNAANLDGGGSSTLVIDGKVINKTGGWNYSGTRYLPDAWIVK